MLDKNNRNFFTVGLILLLIAAWALGNITYLFPFLGDKDTEYGFVGGGKDVQVFNISIYFLLFILAVIILLIFILLIYRSYGKEIFTVPLMIFGPSSLLIIILLTGLSSLEPVIISLTVFAVIGFAYTANKKGWAKFNIALVSVTALIAGPLLYKAYIARRPGTGYISSGWDLDEMIGESGAEFLRGSRNLAGQNIGFIVFGLIVLVGGIYLIAPRVKSYFEEEKEEELDQTQIEENISESVDRAIRDLNEGKDIRSTVIRCYQKMSYVLEDQGVTYDRFMTPREFEENAVDKLDLSREKISDLTDIFEEARYSSHSLKESQRESALKNLRLLREEIG
ncbi:MAG: DUF4129 domain-containing protein [Thermoplasmatota archaeon]